jgi:very-short-patch-repair endonuclease
VRGNADGLTKRQRLPPTTVARSRALRCSAGEPERRLWRALREILPEAKFRRQVPLGPYHADFCAHGAKLIVEVDGDDHAARPERDAARTRFLQDEGYAVIRFANADVMHDLDAVLSAIGAATAPTQQGRP